MATKGTSESRSFKRFTCYTRVQVNSTIGFVRNLSESGFKMHAMSTISVGDGKTAQVKLVPEPELGIGPIEVEGIQQWHAFSGDFTYGFKILKMIGDDSQNNFKQLLKVYSKARE
jgi:hypothetical protein